MLKNPQILQSLLDNDPTFKRMADEHPEIRGMLNDPTMLSMLSDPQVINSALNMANRGSNTSGTMSGNQSSFPKPGGNEEKNNSNQNNLPLNQPQNPNPLFNINQNPNPFFNMNQGFPAFNPFLSI